MGDPTVARLDDKYAYLVNAYCLTGNAKIKGILKLGDPFVDFCNTGKHDGDETGVDCGGSCTPCGG